MSRCPRAGRLWLVSLIVLVSLVSGCTPDKPVDDGAKDAAREPAELKLLVVDDPAMSAAIGELRAEWKARAGSTLVVSETTSDELLAGDALPGPFDAIIYPDALLGTLAERGWIAPLPEDYATNRELAWNDTFELLRLAVTNWGEAPHAISFGSPVLSLYYRADLLAHLHRTPPKTWSEYHKLAELLSRRENLGDAAPPVDAPWSGAAEPLAEGWACGVFLARAAAQAKHRDHFSTLFHIDTMEPLIGGPPYVRALEELAADAKLGPENSLELDAAAVRQEFLDGHLGLAITWPGHAGLRPLRSDAISPPTGFAELPGSASVYNVALKSWEKRATDESPRVPLLGLAGRLGSVTLTTARPAAFRLLAWLSGQEWGAKVSSASPATTLYRRSQIKAPQPWLDPHTDTQAAEQYATGVHDTLSHPTYLMALRIPGRAQYLSALDTAVRQTLAGEKSATDALAEAAAAWRRITDELGLDAQRKAYRLSLGLAPLED